MSASSWSGWRPSWLAAGERERRRALGSWTIHPALPRRALSCEPAPLSPFGRFRPLEPSDRDDIVLPEGFRYDVVIKWGDPFTAAGETFGYNNDWIGVFTLKDDDEALLAVNQEYISVAFLGDVALYPQTFQMLRGRDATIDDFKRDVGVSIVRVRRDPATGAWAPVPKDQ